MCVCVCVRVCLCVCVRVCTYVCMYACMYVLTYNKSAIRHSLIYLFITRDTLNVNYYKLITSRIKNAEGLWVADTSAEFCHQ